MDLNNYNNFDLLVARLQHAYQKLEAEYNVDKARYYLAGWSAGGNIAIGITNSNQNFVAAVMTFPGSGGGVAIPPERPGGAKYYYAVGDQDTGTGFYPGVVTEAENMKAMGYTAHCEVYNGCGHRIEEAKWHARAAAWQWVKGFNLKN
ncbi:MAG: hypothetical protein E3J72_09820 [Planctomycetota bacterium]|nr:MAG: hypothetical protein E3J72_09820 [Planctomycetota bacterium]